MRVLVHCLWVVAFALLFAAGCGEVDTASGDDPEVDELRAFFEGAEAIPGAERLEAHREAFARQSVRASGLRRSGLDTTSEEAWSPVAEETRSQVLPADMRVWQESGDIDAAGAFAPLESACARRGAIDTDGLPAEVRGAGLDARALRLVCALDRLAGTELEIDWTPRLPRAVVLDPGHDHALVNPRLLSLVDGEGAGEPVASGGVSAPSRPEKKKGPAGSGGMNDEEPQAKPLDLDENGNHPRPPSNDSGGSRSSCDRVCDDVWNDLFSCDCNGSPGSGESSGNGCDCGNGAGSSSGGGCSAGGCKCAHDHRGAQDRSGIIVSLVFAGTLVLRRGRKLRLRVAGRTITFFLLALWFLASSVRALAAPPPPKLVDVHVAVTPPEAAVFVDGDAAAPSNGVLRVTPGTHVFSAKLDGYSPAVQTADVPARGTGTLVTLRLVADKGFLVITGSNPALVLTIDGNPVGKGTYSGLVAPGSHVVTAYIPGGESRAFGVDIVIGQSARVNVDGPATLVPRAPEPPVAPVAPSPPVKKEPERPPVPPQVGPYVLVNATVMWQTGRPFGFEHGNTPSPGIALGGRAGYRFSSQAGVEALLEYGHIENGGFVSQTYDIDQNGDGAVSGGEAATDRSPAGYILESLRFGPVLRFMSTGRENRFLGGIGLGALHEQISLDHVYLVWVPPAMSYVATGTYHHSYEGWSPYLLLEGGYERSIRGVLIDVMLQMAIESVSGIGGEPYNSSFQARFGLSLRGGYSLW